MANLRDRLNRINSINRIKRTHQNKTESKNCDEAKTDESYNVLLEQGWQQCGFKVFKREINLTLPFGSLKSKKPIKPLPEFLSIIIPDLANRDLPAPVIEDFLFFDLETTGLSGGAGTVAFLAAFGRFADGKLVITQYLLLDYPGEHDFLNCVLQQLKTENAVIVSYNGKCFDSQIIKTRFLMNRMKPPLYRHADLLHPTRRLWKTIIQDCSQSSVESNILKIERTDDIPGSLAPEIWFEFLKTGATERLTGICDHNVSDIKGLAGILSAMISIAESPFKTDKYNYDTERLARSVYAYAYRQMLIGNYKEPLALIKLALNVLEPDTLWYDKLTRRKKYLERRISNN
ncbi:MAG: ribonuclease H-like domain-containing protein [Treponema sp.]|nr:ribonuclease H-like domain-containing protein [Treponema sp.]